jgi:hypothetical protein
VSSKPRTLFESNLKIWENCVPDRFDQWFDYKKNNQKHPEGHNYWQCSLEWLTKNQCNKLSLNEFQIC